MHFSLIDKITSIEPNVRLTATKNVALSEEYLADHFPLFPVLPGVFMLEAMTQSAAWLIRISDDFAHSIVTLKEAKNVKYANFVAPGSSMQVTVEILKQDGREVKIKAKGEVNGEPCVSGRLTIERYNLSEEDPSKAGLDQRLIQSAKEKAMVLLDKDIDLPLLNPTSV